MFDARKRGVMVFTCVVKVLRVAITSAVIPRFSPSVKVTSVETTPFRIQFSEIYLVIGDTIVFITALRPFTRYSGTPYPSGVL